MGKKTSPQSCCIRFGRASRRARSAVADAIGDALETFFSVSRHGYLEEDKQRRWRRRALMPGLGLPRDFPHPRCSAH